MANLRLVEYHSYMKACGKCGVEKPLTEYYKRTASLDGLQARCKLCTNRNGAENYRKYAERIKKRNVPAKKKLRQRNFQFILEYKQSHSCVDCGESDPDVLDFDHVRGAKVRSVYEMAGSAASLIRLQLEIDKCEIRCANCHRRITRKRERDIRNATIAVQQL